MSIMSFFKDDKPIEKKEVTQQDLMRIITGDASAKQYAPSDLLKYNRSYVYACNNKTAVTVASTPIKLYYNNTSGKKIQATKNHTISRKQMSHIKNTISNINIKQAQDIVEIEAHPFIDLLNNVNPRMNYLDFASLVQSYLGLMGNAFVYVEATNGVPTALYPLMSENVKVLRKDNGSAYGEITGYKVKEGDKDIIYKPEDIIQFLNYQPGNAIYGRGELESCISAAERMMYYDQLENYLNANNARPDFLVVYKNGLKEAEQREVTRSWFKKFGSVKNAGKPMIAGGDVDIKTLGLSPKEMQYAAGRVSAQDEIMAVFGVPEALIRLNSANLASSQSATQHYMKYTVNPKLSAYCEKLNEVLLPRFDDGLFCWYEPVMDADPAQQAEIYNGYIASGVMEVNEVREQLGLEPLEEDVEVEDEVTTTDTTTTAATEIGDTSEE